jgi:UDP-N-acetylmuramoyl-L-alanyl-D-glutamate--2,6-diaminopimelate ligase
LRQYITNRPKTDNIQIIGVTGTDGKTTTVEMLAHILQTHHIPYISSSSLEIKLNGEKISESKRTTPSLGTTLSLLHRAREQGVRVVIIEVSSHALVQWRVLGIKFDTAILTNITHEHLNFHKTKERYAAAKRLLFSKYLKHTGVAILNEQDDYGKQWLNELQCTTRPYKQPQAYTTIHSTEFKYNNKNYMVAMLGTYNAANALAASLAISNTIPEISTDDALVSLSDFSGIPGRMQVIDTGNKAVGNVIVDFALTQRAMASTLSTARELTNGGNVIVVFGATGGQHDTSVRPGLCESVSTYADIAIVTDDEPYDGDPSEIRNELVSLIGSADNTNNNSTQVYNVADRREEIHKGLTLSDSRDTIVVSGMGHYTSRTIDGEEVPWSDSKVISTELDKL